MGKYVTVSVKVPVELRDKMRQLNIRPSTLLRKAIQEEIRKIEIQKIKKEIEELKPTLNKITMKDVVKSIRWDREQK